MAEKVDKKSKSEAKKAKAKEKKTGVDKQEKKKNRAVAEAFSLLADENAIDPSLSSLFAEVAPPKATQTSKLNASTVDEDIDLEDELQITKADGEDGEATASADDQPVERKRKRKRRDEDEDLEATYLDRLSRQEERARQDAEASREAKRQRSDHTDEGADIQNGSGNHLAARADEAEPKDGEDVDEEDGDEPIPRHETQEAADDELQKANRTVFLGNVSTSAISSKTARKTLIKHLSSFFDDIAAPKDGEVAHKVESIRFRSTPYASNIPRKAAFARKELMDATTKSTNAYVVYSSRQLSREAARRLNGTIVLDRHLRVDEVAHPAKTDHRRCVFVGNLGFVDDETNIQDANEEEGREKRKRGKEPADVEEGLWRSFSKCGKVESVRVIRDSTTRVGKGIAYVQFEDEEAVEAALLLDGKKFPPMLPRKLRVSRAKAVKRNAKPGSGRPSSLAQGSKTSGYQRKVSGEEASQIGRTGKLYGRAAAARVKKPSARNGELTAGMKHPEDFVFEGHRATARSGKTGLKLRGKKKGKPTSRSAKRGAAFKASKKKAA